MSKLEFVEKPYENKTLASIEDARKEILRVASNDVFDMHVTVDVALSWLDEIEHEITVLQKCWAQEAREHTDESAKLAELAHENAKLKRKIAEKCMESLSNGVVKLTNEIIPCPWCGNEADLVEMETKCDNMVFYKVSCNDYKCIGANIHMWYKTKLEAIKAWNTRAELESYEYIYNFSPIDSKLESSICTANKSISESADHETFDVARIGISKDKIHDFSDSREKLEADVHQYANPNDYKNTLGASWEKKMVEFLDRQAGITKCECESEFNALDEHAQMLERENVELKAKVDGYVEALEKLGCSVLANGTVFWPSDYGASCSEPQKQADELQDTYDEMVGKRNELQAENADLQAKVNELERSLAFQKSKTAAMKRGREYWHEQCRVLSERDHWKKSSYKHAQRVKQLESELDSREKPEADVRKEIEDYAGRFLDGEKILYELIVAMLDRQEAITLRECKRVCDTCNWPEVANEQRLIAMREADKNAELQARVDELIHAVNELQKKQPYCYDPDNPVDTLNTIGRYIDELIAERDEWKVKAEEEAANAEDHWKNAKNIMKECDARARALDMQLKNIHNLEHERNKLQEKVRESASELYKLLDLTHYAWDIAVCATRGIPIPASWSNVVKKGLREYGIDVDELPYTVLDTMLSDGECDD